MNYQTCSNSQPSVARIGNQIYQPPRLSYLGEVCQLTETGSMAGMESPLNLCILQINMTYNSCKP